jgi:hypothetical protein
MGIYAAVGVPESIRLVLEQFGPKLGLTDFELPYLAPHVGEGVGGVTVCEASSSRCRLPPAGGDVRGAVGGGQ